MDGNSATEGIPTRDNKYYEFSRANFNGPVGFGSSPVLYGDGQLTD